MNKLHVFPNGLRLCLYKSDYTRSVSVGVYVDAGAVYESESESGISHFIEHMMFKGTAKRTAFDIADEMESLGAQINAFTAREMTCYYTISTCEHLVSCVDVLSDMFFDSEFSPKEMEKEKKVVMEEIRSAEDDPEDVCAEGLATALYGNSVMGRPILGDPHNVSAFTREDILAYVGRRYVPSSTVISVAGYFDEQEVIDLIGEKFASRFQNTIIPTRSERVAELNGQFVKFKQLEQANVGFAFPAYGYSDELRDSAILVSNVFGGAMSSRLFQSVREQKGLVYDVYASTSAYVNNGAISVYFGASPLNVGAATATVGAEIRKLMSGGLTQKELNKGVEQLKASVVLGSESAVSVMRANGKNVILTGKLFDVDGRLASIESITSDKVAKVIAEVFDFDRVASSYVGPETDVNVHDIIRGVNNG